MFKLPLVLVWQVMPKETKAAIPIHKTEGVPPLHSICSVQENKPKNDVSHLYRSLKKFGIIDPTKLN